MDGCPSWLEGRIPLLRLGVHPGSSSGQEPELVLAPPSRAVTESWRLRGTYMGCVGALTAHSPLTLDFSCSPEGCWSGRAGHALRGACVTPPRVVGKGRGVPAHTFLGGS